MYYVCFVSYATQAPGELPIASDGFMLLRGPVRGGLAAATAAGRVLLLDARTKWQVGACDKVGAARRGCTLPGWLVAQIRGGLQAQHCA